MIKSFSLVAMAALVMVGCGSSGKSGEPAAQFVTKNTNAVTISGLQSLGETVSKDSLISVKSSASNTYSKDSDTGYVDNGQPCDTGSMTFSGGEGSSSFSLDAQNCVKDGSTMNGALSATISEASKTASGTVLRDFTVVEEGVNLFLAKGSKVSINNQIIRADFQAEVNDEVISADNLSVNFAERSNGASFSFTSGKVNIAGYYFEFVSQPSPFVIGESGIESGILRLKDGAGHKVELVVESVNHLYLGVDENGDGQITESEKLRDNFLAEDFTL